MVRAQFATLLFCVLLMAPLSVRAGPYQASQPGETRNPHGALKEPCQSCHTLTSWKPIRSRPEFDHSQTRYPLSGMHAAVDCRSCHVKLVFTNVGTKCADCHADIHRGQFGAKCEGCHTVNGWNVSVRDVKGHSNRFPLFGAHATLECGACHTSAAVGRFTGLSTACVSCHLRDYQNTKAMGFDHTAMGFPTTCESCHGMDSWLSGGRFDHSKTPFPLTGAHVTVPCASCHIGGRFAGTPTDCYSCHKTDYQGTTNPNHLAAGFPTTCQTCHTTVAWTGAAFNHTWFSLPHHNAQCSDCHVTSSNYATFVCTNCHTQGETDPQHQGVQGYVWNSANCYACHKN